MIVNKKEITSILGERLNNEVQLIVCTKDINNKVLPDSLVQLEKSKVVHAMTNLFFGCTVTSATGTWSNNGQIEEEPNYILSSNFNDNLMTGEMLTEIKRLAVNLKKELNQDAVSIKVNGELFFI